MSNPETTPPRRWPLFLLGGLLFVAGPVGVAIQYLALHHLTTPWYLPVLSTLGVALMALSVWQRGSVLRIVGLCVFALICAAQWFMIGYALRAPEYTGPAQPNQKAPAFTALRVDGSSFTQADLATGSPSVLLFFRGHW
jgi:hypothetical protein